MLTQQKNRRIIIKTHSHRNVQAYVSRIGENILKNDPNTIYYPKQSQYPQLCCPSHTHTHTHTHRDVHSYTSEVIS